MLQAKILKRSTTAIAGEAITLDQLADAVETFNQSPSSKLVTLSDYPCARLINLDEIAASAELRMDGEEVIASLKFHNTPHGRIVTELAASGVKIYLTPVTEVIPANSESGRRLRIERLIVPRNPASPFIDTPMQQVKDWVTGGERWPMYQLKDK